MAASSSMAPPPQPMMMDPFEPAPFFYRHPRPLHVRVHKVTAENLHYELSLIRLQMLRGFYFVAVDTQFPGEVYRHPRWAALNAEEQYAVVKANADELHLLQLGITICDAHGRLPVGLDADDGALDEFTWEVDFSDFDARCHLHVSESVEFLRRQGLDFEAARHFGVPAAEFAAELAHTGILGFPGLITWVTFGGMYDVAFLLKLVTGGAPLPESRQGFIAQVGARFGSLVFDGKYMASVAHVHGSLPAVAGMLRLPPLLPYLHMAGPNSVMAMHVFMEMKRRFLLLRGGHRSCSLRIDGLT